MVKPSGRTLARQGRLSRHKVSVGEPADGSPPIDYLNLQRGCILRTTSKS